MNKSKKELTIERELKPDESCPHHWIVKSAAGPISIGVCKFCGANKEFGNYLRDCLEIDRDSYKDWAESPWRDQGKKKELGKFLTELKGGDRDAVKTGI